jgi:4-amino-4-deoxy-L-arabinose transferase-like glycosyltransferase
MKQRAMNSGVDFSKLSIWFLVAVLAVSFFYNLGAAPLFDVDEGAFSEATREMFERGDFISTYLNGVPRYDKPILVYWLQALSVLLLGVTETAFRLPSAVAAALWILSIFRFVGKELDRETALTSALMGAVGIWMFVLGRAATADATVNLFIALSLFDIYRFSIDGSAASRNRAFVWAALGFLTKGPIAVVVPLGVGFLFLLSEGRVKDAFRAATHPAGLALFALIAAPWYVAQYVKEGQPFIDGFFLRHNVSRYLSPMEGHSGGLYYYPLAALVIVLPFTGILLRMIPKIRSSLKNPFERFLWIWFGFVLVFFSFSGTKLPHYLMHGVTPLFILMAIHRGELRNRWLAFVPPLVLLIAIAALPDVLNLVRPHVQEVEAGAVLDLAAQSLGESYRFWTLAVMTAGAALAISRRLPPWQGLIFTGVLIAFLVGQTLLPTAGGIAQGPVKEAGRLAADKEWNVVMWRVDMPSFSVYRGAPTPRRDPLPGEVAFTRVDKLKDLPTHELLYSKGNVALARISESHD